jgi:hypothetical protein
MEKEEEKDRKKKRKRKKNCRGEGGFPWGWLTFFFKIKPFLLWVSTVSLNIVQCGFSCSFLLP